jgi:hypothetical protein
MAALQHERVCTFMVSSDGRAQASQNEIRTALESGEEHEKITAMQKAIAALLNGEQLPQLFITIVRYVLPSENHQLQKLLLLYLVRGERDPAKIRARRGPRAARHASRPPRPPLTAAAAPPAAPLHLRRRRSRRRTPPASSSPR